MILTRRYSFQSAHFLPNVPPGHKCGRVHGHTYELEVSIEGPVDPTLGWVMDFAMLDAIVSSLITSVIDHRMLNEIPGLENPTSEVIAQWIFDRLSVSIATKDVEVSCVSVGENGYSRVECRRP